MASELSVGEILLSSDPEIIAKADRLVLPGVGSFRDCRQTLTERGLDEAIMMVVRERCVPFLGICVGMQLMASIGYEHGKTKGFGWIPGEVKRLRRLNEEMKIPHMGWNELLDVSNHPVFVGIKQRTDVYFVHSYQLETKDDAHCIAATEYGDRLTASVGVDNMVGTQFHPEKSQSAGLRIIGNFLMWNPS